MEEEALSFSRWNVSSEEEAEDFAADVLPTSFFVVHDASRCGHHDEAELKKETRNESRNERRNERKEGLKEKRIERKEE